MQKAARFANGEIEKSYVEEKNTMSNEKDFFADAKDEIVENDFALTDNGALVYASSGSALVDFDFNTSSLRSADSEEIATAFEKFFYTDKDTAMRYLFYVGDIREGKGERHIFNEVLMHLASTSPELIKAVLPLIPEYTRWDYLVNLVKTPLRDDVVAIIKEQLSTDIEAAKNDKPISLCAKWLPSINASKKDTIEKALIICDALNMDKKTYRKTLSLLRDKLNVIEKVFAEKDVKKLAAMQESLSSKQNYKYSAKLDELIPEERKAYLDAVLRGEANYNVDVLEPHEIYFRYASKHKQANQSYETMWKMLPNKVRANKNVLVVRDGSYSMTVGIPGTNHGSVLDVASALTVYFSQNVTGGFKDKFITFSSRPQLVDMSNCNTLMDKMRLLSTFTDCSNTNIEATFDLILNTAIKNNYKQEELPTSVLIISDMQFDYALGSRWNETLFETISNKFEAAGYKIPRLIFWNVNNSKTAIPAIKNELGLVLLGGYSKNIVSMICEDEFEKEVIDINGEVKTVQLTPEEILVNKIKSERYDAISDAISPVLKAERSFRDNSR